METNASSEQQLSSFVAEEREAALSELLKGVAEPAPGANVNLHLHSFYSYNAEGYSPSRLVWEARKAGLYAAGLCDFDVLDGLDEFLGAGLKAGLRTAVHLETRAYLKPFAAVDISSPGEPGVTYIMGGGFTGVPKPGTPQGKQLAAYRASARERNLGLLARVNPHVGDLAIDYEADVLPLTPAGVATERHIISAYVSKAEAVCPERAALASTLGDLLERSPDEMGALLDARPALEEVVRARFAKRGGFGYEQPSEATFPPAAEFMAWVAACGAIPMVTWLDGTSGGESDPEALLDCMIADGAAALNIIPDRNWNYDDSDKRAVMAGHLDRMVCAAQARDLPINIGTEMNKRGLPFVDDLAGPVLQAYADCFREGANIMVGHTLLGRYADYGYVSEGAVADLPTRSERNAVFAHVGQKPALTEAGAQRLEAMGPDKARGELLG